MRVAKRIVAVLACLAVLLALPFSFGCDRGDDGVEILCTVFPIYDWARSIIGESEGVTLSLLVENGTDMHSFQPSFSDVAKIKRCDVLILVGGESDRWVAEAADEDATVIKLSELEGIRLYEVSAESGEHEHDEEHEHGAFDEHMWLSVKNAITATEALTDEICKQIANALEARELIKARVLENSGYTAKEAAAVISEAISCEVVSCVGTKFVLYKESEKKKRIEL